MKHLKTFESTFRPLSYSGGDVTKMPIIGKIITKPVGPFESGEYNVVEIIKDDIDRDIYVVNQWYKEGRVPNIIHSEMVEEFIPGEISEGYGGPSAAPGLAGQTIGVNWSSSKTAEPDKLAIPMNPGGSNRVFQKIPIRKSRFHRSTRDKKRRPGVKDILFKRKQDFTNKEGGVEKPGKVMSFQNFYKDDTTTVKSNESLATTIGALGMAVSSVLKPGMPKDLPIKEPIEDTTLMTQGKNDLVEDFVQTVIDKDPNLVTNDSIDPNNPFTGYTLPVSFLEDQLDLFNSIKIKSFQRYNTELKLSLSDLDILSEHNFPFHINYFYVRGVDNENGPVLMPILNLNYTNVVKVHGHDIEFNFTRITGINTFGAKINF